MRASWLRQPSTPDDGTRAWLNVDGVQKEGAHRVVVGETDIARS